MAELGRFRLLPVVLHPRAATMGRPCLARSLAAAMAAAQHLTAAAMVRLGRFQPLPSAPRATAPSTIAAPPAVARWSRPFHLNLRPWLLYFL